MSGDFLLCCSVAIIRKKFGNRVYLYDVICKRVNGKPRIVSQKYLGKPEDVYGSPKLEPKAKAARIYDYGAITALLKIAQELKLVETIDAVVGKRRQGVSVGQYILLAALNRAVAPKSKRQLGDWYRQTILWRHFGFKRRQLTSQRFWDNMGLLTQCKIDKIERRLNESLIQHWDINLAGLIYDTTNFYTFINTQTKCQLPQRGHNKQRRSDLRQVGLALLVTRDYGIPLLHRVYAGNEADTTQFGRVVGDLTKRHRMLAQGCEDITLVFDKGNNARKNQVVLDQTAFHFVGSLVATQHRSLLAVSRQEYRAAPLVGGKSLLAYRTQQQVMGELRTVVVTYNPKLAEAQERGIRLTVKHKTPFLNKLAEKRKVTEATMTLAVKRILVGQYLQEVVNWRVVDGRFQWWLDEEGLNRLRRERLGKKILFTDQHEWTTGEIIQAYHGQYVIEHAFRQMKDPYFISWWPMFHWTDQKMMVHGFYCVLALLLVSLLTKRVREAGKEIGSQRLLALLDGIKEVAVIYPLGKAGAATEYVRSELFGEAAEVQELLKLGQ
jgi:transposase